MKKQVISSLLLLIGMLSCLGVFLFAFPFWDVVLWLLYIPVLLFVVAGYHHLLLRRRKKVILILAGCMITAGVLSFPLLQKGADVYKRQDVVRFRSHCTGRPYDHQCDQYDPAG